jgi:CheY-like chemotaxis protein
VLDDRMPTPTGIQVSERVNGDPQLRHVRVMMLSANDSPLLASAARIAGAVAIIDKAKSRRDIVAAIKDAAR